MVLDAATIEQSVADSVGSSLQVAGFTPGQITV